MKWVDFSVWQGRVSLGSLQLMKSQGVEGIWVGSWHGRTGNPHVAGILADARGLGLETGTYIVFNSMPGEKSVELGRDYCGSEWEHLRFAAADVEVPTTVPILQAGLDAIEGYGMRPAFYSARWFLSFWASQLTYPPVQFAKYAYIYALYNGVPNLDFRPDTGLWPKFDKAVGHQYTGSTPAFGTTVDFNFFDRMWVNAWPSVAPPPPQPPREEVIMGAIVDQLKAAGEKIEAELAAAKLLPEPVVGPTGPPGPQGPAGETVTVPSGSQTYTVVAGDNLTKIAAKFGVSVDALYTKNKAIIGPDPDLIQPGQVLTIP